MQYVVVEFVPLKLEKPFNAIVNFNTEIILCQYPGSLTTGQTHEKAPDKTDKKASGSKEARDLPVGMPDFFNDEIKQCYERRHCCGQPMFQFHESYRISQFFSQEL